MDSHATLVNNNNMLELLEVRDAELRKVHKLKMVVDEVRQLNMGSEQTPEIKHALKLLSIDDYIRIGETDRDHDYLLDLHDSFNSTPLSYVDSKAVRTKLTQKLRMKLKDVVEFGDMMRAELPDVFAKEADADITTQQKQIIHLEDERRTSLEKLVNLRYRKCELMKTVAELKLGPHMIHELQLKQAEAQVLQTKADVLRDFIIKEIVERTEHSIKAHKEVEQYLDELLKSDKTAPKGSRRN